MGLAGLGAIRAMQDSLKMNRAQRKKHRKSAGELAKSHPARSGKITDRKKISAADLAAFRLEIKAKRRRERFQKGGLIAGLITAGVLFLFLMFT